MTYICCESLNESFNCFIRERVSSQSTILKASKMLPVVSHKVTCRNLTGMPQVVSIYTLITKKPFTQNTF